MVSSLGQRRHLQLLHGHLYNYRNLLQNPIYHPVKILRMKSGQSSCSCTNPVHLVIQFRKAVPYGIHTIQVSNVICIILHLTVQNRKILPGCIPCLHIGTIIRYTCTSLYTVPPVTIPVAICDLPACFHINFIGRTSICIRSFIHRNAFQQLLYFLYRRCRQWINPQTPLRHSLLYQSHSWKVYCRKG